MLQLPLYIPLLFMVTTLVTVLLFYKATRHNKKILLLITGWMIFQSVLSLTGFYKEITGHPIRLLLLNAPLIITLTGLLVFTKGRKWLNSLSLKWLTLLHIIRIPVEIVLLLLSRHHVVPQLMTFEGINFDIISGITAPLIYYVAFHKKHTNRIALLAWNLICLGLLLNIVIHAILSVPAPFQQFAFEQPAIAVQYFPFVWLPAVVVPVVLLAHLASIRLLFRMKNTG